MTVGEGCQDRQRTRHSNVWADNKNTGGHSLLHSTPLKKGTGECSMFIRIPHHVHANTGYLPTGSVAFIDTLTCISREMEGRHIDRKLREKELEKRLRMAEAWEENRYGTVPGSLWKKC